MKITLCDLEKELVKAWEREFEGIKDIEIIHGNIFDVQADALVTPGNNLGYMSGGLDLEVTRFFERSIQDKVLKVVETKYNGDMDVGNAEIIGTGNIVFPFLIYAPTMRLTPPQKIFPYKTMLAVLKSLKEFNKNKIKSLVIPGLGTGNAGVPFRDCARQMREAYLKSI